jgi:hypothetical protein
MNPFERNQIPSAGRAGCAGVAALLLGLASPHTARAQAVRQARVGSAPAARPSALDDLDGDGVRDAIRRADDGRSLALSLSRGRSVVVRGTDATFGQSFAIAPDLDGDGAREWVVGAPGNAGDDGAVFVYRGGSAGPSTEPWIVLRSPVRDAQFGISVAGLGDTDGDGLGDLAVGAYRADDGTGRVFVYHGHSSGLAAQPDATLAPDNRGENFGYAVARGGDLDGDGFADLAVGADLANDRRGRVYVYSGSRSGLRLAQVLEGAHAHIDFGIAIAGVGDTNGDGRDDLVVGAINARAGRGEAYVFHGGARGVEIAPAQMLAASAPGWTFGIGVVASGDTDGDGLADFVVEGSETDGLTPRREVFRGVR